MSEILRKFMTEFPTLAAICGDCGKTFAVHDSWECPKNPQRVVAPTEMTSLREIKDKLDDLKAGILSIKEQLRTMDAGLHETAMRNHVQLLDGQKNLGGRMDLAFDILGGALSKQPRKARKKARRPQEK